MALIPYIIAIRSIPKYHNTLRINGEINISAFENAKIGTSFQGLIKQLGPKTFDRSDQDPTENGQGEIARISFIYSVPLRDGSHNISCQMYDVTRKDDMIVNIQPLFFDGFVWYALREY